MSSALEDSPLFQAVMAAHSEPSTGLPRLQDAINLANREGRFADAHVLADNFVSAACRAKSHLESAEGFARLLVDAQPDRHHLNHLAWVLELKGASAEAEECRRKASLVADEHRDEEIDQAIREAEELLKNRSAND